MARAPKELGKVGLGEVDRLRDLSTAMLADYLAAASRYVIESPSLNPSQKKVGQILLSQCLGKALLDDLRRQLPGLRNVVVGERVVGGALRTVNADVSEIHPTDGLRLAVEIKPVNLAVGRAIWNRFGDIRTFAVNLHLKFPFAVVGGVLAIPTFEWSAGRASSEEDAESALEAAADAGRNLGRKLTEPLIRKAVARLVRAGGRRTEGDAPHLLEAIAVVVYDPETATLSPDLPPPGSHLRWDEFIHDLARAYEARFEI
jgi:hypothetical protein